MYPSAVSRRLLVVDASHTVDRPLAIASVQANADLVFADSREDALERVPAIDAMVVLPPLGSGDAFALVRNARLRRPGLPAAIVLGDGRVEGAPPRVVWSDLGPDQAELVAAVIAIASLRITPEELGWWDETATALMKVAL